MKVLHLGAALAAVVGLLLGSVSAQPTDRQQNQLQQQEQKKPEQQNQVGQQQRQRDRQRTRSPQTEHSIVKASELIGMKVKNEKEELGYIEDLVIEPDSGKIEYVAVSIGGVLGIGDKLVAVPWKSIECRPEKGSSSEAGQEAEKIAMLNVEKEKLKNIEGFDQDNWPDMANSRWRQENDRQFQTSRRSERQGLRSERTQE